MLKLCGMAIKRSVMISQSKAIVYVPAFNSGCNKGNKSKKDTSDKLKAPVDGSAAEFFGRKPTIEEIQKLLSPEGFLSETQYKDYDGVTPLGKFEQLQPTHKKSTDEQTPSDATMTSSQTESTEQSGDYMKSNLNEWGMPKEVGFKVKGPEPTRFGDWERKGRVTDF